MNRADKRRRTKLADKAAKTSMSAQAPAEQGQTLSIQQALELAVQHHQAGDLPKAEAIYQQILQADSNQPIALHFLGLINHQVGKNDFAYDLISKALASKPDYAEAYYTLGIVQQELGHQDEAVESFRKAISFKPDYLDAYSNLGNSLQWLGKFDEAVACYNKALIIKPDFAEVYSNLGNSLQALGKLDEAVVSYNKALDIKPDFVEAHCNRGNALKELGNLDDAVACYNKALAINPDYADALLNIAFVHKMRGDRETAIETFQSILRLDPNNLRAKYTLSAMTDELAGTPSPEYVELIYAPMAAVFDKKMLEWDCHLPRLVLSAATRWIEENEVKSKFPFLSVLDLGCGTGRVGEEFRDISGNLHGVDLSSEMIDKARSKSVYDELFVEEIELFLEHSMGTYDLILAVDSLLYMGPLNTVFENVSHVLKRGGAFAFTVEKLDSGNFALRDSCRHAHSVEYIRQLATENQLDVVLHEQIDNMRLGVEGDLFWLELSQI